MPIQKDGPNPVHRFIAVGCVKDIHTWEVASSAILRHIEANHYQIIVPSGDVSAFRKCTPGVFEIVDETQFTKYVSKLIAAEYRRIDKLRRSWYLQQFIKLIALDEIPDYEIAVIWDADTVPLRNLVFSDDSGRVVYRKGSEFHYPYFTTIQRLLGYSKLVEPSFIAQCFPVRKRWIREFRLEIENRHSRSWLEALVMNIDFLNTSGFSEYETLGTFIAHNYPYDLAFTDEPWLREGIEWIGSARNIGRFWTKPLLRGYGYASFDTWQQPFAKLKSYPIQSMRGLLRRILM